MSTNAALADRLWAIATSRPIGHTQTEEEYHTLREAALLLGGVVDSLAVTDDEATLVRETVAHHRALGDPYAWHRGLEQFLRMRAPAITTPTSEAGEPTP